MPPLKGEVSWLANSEGLLPAPFEKFSNEICFILTPPPLTWSPLALSGEAFLGERSPPAMHKFLLQNQDFDSHLSPFGGGSAPPKAKYKPVREQKCFYITTFLLDLHFQFSIPQSAKLTDPFTQRSLSTFQFSIEK